ncbi:16S rRNA (guanine(966)-N(2))-methyltransferase RsmD [Lysobacter sp. A3-1-A15]|uniref:16S rRNA (guanine(966)-N(2))-methyltransferase RsmD n=1 Tax=Novilysobacter viscosus TaxID=3098602 RepID=UPI002ED84590
MNKASRNGRTRAGQGDARAPGVVRIIAGRWRGTRLPVPDVEGLRPTTDRVRETLFNWLQPVLPGAQVLDLFAGSGALGLEALSRGADGAVLVERDRTLAGSLVATLERLPGGEAGRVVNADAVAWLARQPVASWDIAFVDPPFAADLWQPALGALLPRMRADAWLYLESPVGAAHPLPTDWHLHRESRSRDVRHALYRRVARPADTLPPDVAGAVPAGG